MSDHDTGQALLDLAEPDDAAWLRIAFLTLLGREPDPAGARSWRQQLADGSADRRRIVTSILESEELAGLEQERRRLLGGYLDEARERPGGFGRLARLQLEVTTYCNLRCAMCPKAWEQKRSSHFPIALATRLDCIAPTTELTFFGFGEPLVNPHFWDLVESLGGDLAGCGFVTNGLLIDAACAQRIVANGFGWVNVSIDAATAQTYERIRGAGRRFEQLRQRIAHLARVRGGTKPRIQINMTIMRSNLAEVVAFAHLARELGVDDVLYAPLNPLAAPGRVTRAPDGSAYDYEAETLRAADPVLRSSLDEARRFCASHGLGFQYMGDYVGEAA